MNGNKKKPMLDQKKCKCGKSVYVSTQGGGGICPCCGAAVQMTLSELYTMQRYLEMENPMKAYQVIGHYLSLAPKHISSRTFSDGTIFRLRHDAEKYAKEKMHPGAIVREVENVLPIDITSYKEEKDYETRI